MKSLYLLIALALSAAPVSNGQDAKGIKTQNLKGADLALMNNHDPASELANFELLPGYQANLFAADPMLANPVHMNWDSKGRLWVACSWSYPQIKPGEVANDKIIILEDTDDDGALTSRPSSPRGSTCRPGSNSPMAAAMSANHQMYSS